MDEFHIEHATLFCRKCGRNTPQSRAIPRMVWVLDWVFGVCTLSLWWILAAMYRTMTGSHGRPWVCTLCYRSPPKLSHRPHLLLLFLFLGLIVGVVLLLKYLPSLG
jgi:hypothetical protein